MRNERDGALIRITLLIAAGALAATAIARAVMGHLPITSGSLSVMFFALACVWPKDRR